MNQLYLKASIFSP
jgi:hypothetical protein